MVNVQQHGSTASAQQSSSQFSQSGRARFASSSARMRGKHAGASRHGGVQLTAASPSSFFLSTLCKIPRHSSKQTAWSSIAAQPARGQLALGHRRMLLLRAQCGRAKERALLACFLVACLGVHMLVVHMPLCRPARCVRQLQASQPASMCNQSVSQLHLGSPPRKFGSVQFSSVIGYWLSVIGYRLSVISPHVVVRMPFDLDPVFFNT